MNFTDKMLGRLDKQEEVLKERLNNLRNMVKRGKWGGEEEREWLDSVVDGRGVDIACGDFPIRAARGVDGDERKIGAYYFCQGDELTRLRNESQDFVVTNYFDAMPDVLKALQEWWRVLKSGGTLAFICCDASAYSAAIGPLDNHHRLNAFTKRSVECYLARAGFKKVEITTSGKFLRVKCTK
ncbi:MAG: class I SAM-dependent methyltransferase [Candidatus Thorarchaeota archaeon]|jgi:SAM-dependent methyltransferase